MKRTKTRKRKRRIGNSLRHLLACAAGVWVLTALLPAQADRGALKQYALIAGTVFDESGMSLRGAELLLVPAPQDARAHKLKKMEAFSDSRGEFAFRVPAAAARYTIKIRRKGFEPQEKPVQVQGDERIDLTFRLAPAR